jgi:hypothetical protein
LHDKKLDGKQKNVFLKIVSIVDPENTGNASKKNVLHLLFQPNFFQMIRPDNQREELYRNEVIYKSKEK